MGGFETYLLEDREERARNDVKSRSHIHPSFHFLFCEAFNSHKQTASHAVPRQAVPGEAGQTLMMTRSLPRCSKF